MWLGECFYRCWQGRIGRGGLLKSEFVDVSCIGSGGDDPESYSSLEMHSSGE